MTSKNPFFDKRMIILNVSILLIAVAMQLIGPTETLDAKLYYTGTEARNLLAGYGPRVLANYLTVEFLDLALISLYTAALVITFKEKLKVAPPWWLLCFLPGALDVVETGAIIYAIRNNLDLAFFDYLGIVTALKWLASVVVLLPFIPSVRARIQKTPGSR